MLLCGAPCLSVGYLSVVYEFVDHGVILRAEEHLSWFGRTCRTEMIYPTVANMRHGGGLLLISTGNAADTVTDCFLLVKSEE